MRAIEEAEGQHHFENTREKTTPNRGRWNAQLHEGVCFSAPPIDPVAETVSVGPISTVVEEEIRPFALPCEICAEQRLSRIDGNFIDGGVLAANNWFYHENCLIGESESA